MSGGYYFDTSSLVAHYHCEAGTECVDKIFSDASRIRVISRLGYLEMLSAFAMKVRSGDVSLDGFTLLRHKLRQDIATHALRVCKVGRSHWERAESLVVRYSPTQRLRAMDAIQLATAQLLLANGVVDAFVCCDAALVAVARVEKVCVVNPLDG